MIKPIFDSNLLCLRAHRGIEIIADKKGDVLTQERMDKIMNQPVYLSEGCQLRIREKCKDWQPNYYSKITAKIPDHFVFVAISGQELESLPEMSPYLQILCCNKNKLTKIDSLGENLLELRASRNEISKMPQSFPLSLSEVDLRHNKFSQEEKDRIVRECEKKNIKLKI